MPAFRVLLKNLYLLQSVKDKFEEFPRPKKAPVFVNIWSRVQILIEFRMSLTQKPFVAQTSNFEVLLIRDFALFSNNFVLI